MKVIIFILLLSLSLMVLTNNSQTRIIYQTPKVHYKHVPINVRTRGEPPSYKQIGVLFGDDKVLPLYGRQTYKGSYRYNYYTKTDTYNPLRLSVVRKNQDCTKNIGCKELYDGDNLKLKELNETFKVSLYEKEGPRYIPFYG